MDDQYTAEAIAARRTQTVRDLLNILEVAINCEEHITTLYLDRHQGEESEVVISAIEVDNSLSVYKAIRRTIHQVESDGTPIENDRAADRARMI